MNPFQRQATLWRLGFVKIRHYGLLANRTRELRLKECRRLLLMANVAAALPNTEAVRGAGSAALL